ncbi:hypothetical protein QFZ96_001850 [Paraburkholderia youngii]
MAYGLATSPVNINIALARGHFYCDHDYDSDTHH